MLPIPPDTLLQQRYRILEILGEGQFGRTYLATDTARSALANQTKSDEYCAITELIPSAQFPASVLKAKEFFQQEAPHLYQLQNPQIPRLWATFEERNRLFIVQDYIDGKTYRQLLEERRNIGSQFSEFEVWQFLLKILPPLSYIHSKGVVHRNLSPDNIILRDRDFLPVPIDFGVVKEFALKLQPNPDHQRLDLVGQPGYAPTEQLQTGRAYPHSDLYAVAVMAIVLLSGKAPTALFEGEQISWEWRKWTEVSDGLSNILLRMLSPQPHDRYQSASEVFQSLQALEIPQREASPGRQGNRPSTMPTQAVGSKPDFANTNPAHSGITHLKSVWEKPQVFIPTGILISLLAGVGSWFGVTYFLHNNRPVTPVATTPPKQVDFTNPTIPTDTNPIPPTNSSIEPIMGKAIVKEGTVDVKSPVRYRVPAVSGQNLDIILMPIGNPTVDPLKSPAPTNSTIPGTSKLNPPAKTLKPAIAPSPTPVTLVPTQVLMTVLSPTGIPIDPQADRVVGWRGTIPATGDYTIELRPIAGLTGNAIPYKLSVSQIAPIQSAPISGKDPDGTPPIIAPVPSAINGNNPIFNNRQPNNPGNVMPSMPPAVVPIEIPSTPPIKPEPQNRPVRQAPERETPRPPRRKQIVTEPEQPAPTRERERPASNEEDNPPPRRKRKPAVISEPPTRSQPSESREFEGTDTNIKPQSEPQISPPTNDNQAPEPNTTDGGNSKTPTTEPKPSPSPSPTSIPTDPD